MSTLTGNFKSTNAATIAASITLIDAHLDIEEARLTVLSGASTLITGNLTLLIHAENAGNDPSTHKVTISLNCTSVANAKVVTAALSTFCTAMEGASAYTDLVAVDAIMTTNFSN